MMKNSAAKSLAEKMGDDWGDELYNREEPIRPSYKESERPTKTYLDMDGVVADFFRGACNLHGYAYSEYPDGEWYMEDVFGISWDEFAKDMDVEWWANLPKCPDADYIVSKTISPIFLTSHMDGRCVDGKHLWVEKHYPEIGIVFTHDKALVACGSSVLIDDRDTNCNAFLGGGGLAAIHIPSEWRGCDQTPREVFDVEYIKRFACPVA